MSEDKATRFTVTRPSAPCEHGSYYGICDECQGLKDAYKQPTEGLKYDESKPPLGLLSYTALKEVSKVLDFGANKYDTHNWRQGIGHQRLVNAALRHIFAWNEGEDADEETGLSHLAHALCCLMFALEEHELRPQYDDRWKRS